MLQGSIVVAEASHQRQPLPLTASCLISRYVHYTVSTHCLAQVKSMRRVAFAAPKNRRVCAHSIRVVFDLVAIFQTVLPWCRQITSASVSFTILMIPFIQFKSDFVKRNTTLSWVSVCVCAFRSQLSIDWSIDDREWLSGVVVHRQEINIYFIHFLDRCTIIYCVCVCIIWC